MIWFDELETITLGGQQKITRIVEQVLNRFEFNIGFANQPYFVSVFPDCVLQVEVPRGCKTPKSLTKVSGDKDESTVEHIARYIVEL